MRSSRICLAPCLLRCVDPEGGAPILEYECAATDITPLLPYPLVVPFGED